MRISLINMPMAPVSHPSIGLTQLKSILDSEFEGREIDTSIQYFNLEFLEFFGHKAYRFLNEHDNSRKNFAEWYFRQEAFPTLQDNTEVYLERFGLSMNNWFKELDPYERSVKSPFLYRKMLSVVDDLCRKRDGLGGFMDQLILENQLHKTDVVGFTSMFRQNLPSFALARRIKLLNPKAIIVMGGANCESPMGEQIAQHIEAVDYVFSGPALISFPTFIKHLLEGRVEKCDQIDGVFSKKNIANIRPLGRERDINEVVELNYDSFLEEATPILTKYKRRPKLFFETARGCWWGEKAHCTFCGLNGSTMAFRAMKPDTAISYLASLFDRYGHAVRNFSCVDNIMPKAYPHDVFSKLEVPEGISIFYEIKSDVGLEEMKILRSRGVTTMQPGIEAMDSSVLKLMKKGVTSVQNILTLKNASTTGIKILWNLLFGFPGESEETYLQYEKQLPNLFHLTPPFGLSSVRFDRYSPYHIQADEYGLNLKPMEVYSYLYPDLGEETMMSLVYFFQDHNVNQEYQILARKWFPTLKKIKQKWIHRWKKLDNLEHPELYQIRRTNQVFDSRNGKVIQHQLSEHQMEILDLLAEPGNIGKLRSGLSKGARETLEQDLPDLLNKGLVFHDRMKSFISLVFEEPVQSPSKVQSVLISQNA